MHHAIAARYRRFAVEEARGRSPLYEALTGAIAEDGAVLDFLAALPSAKQQPNLLLAAFRHLFGVPADYPSFRDTLLARAEAVAAVMLARSTQTNEPGRCAVLLPLLARIPGPLALLEVGASAGLCLLPDRYGYDYGTRAFGAASPRFCCAASPGTPLPAALPEVVWRAGLDLNPLDPASAEDAAWLETLVWPEQAERAAKLHAALGLARAEPPRVVRGDLRHDLAALAAEAPREATLVIFHTAVLAYVESAAERAAFAADARRLCDHWIANEAPGVVVEATPPLPGRFVLTLNGVPQAWTDPHGRAMEWI